MRYLDIDHPDIYFVVVLCLFRVKPTHPPEQSNPRADDPPDDASSDDDAPVFEEALREKRELAHV